MPLRKTETNNEQCIVFEVITAVAVETTVFWIVAPCSWGRELCFCLLLGFLFDPEDGVDIFLRNVGLSPNYTALLLTRPYSSSDGVPSCNTDMSEVFNCGFYG
jgi:hypothetical protein